ncbi:hypothetical protein RHGRI_010343 [Rhododendron griersonianum]|uniref:Uncharacterized protein n=1 Tax=Rhododendron griersonianum TaxID=479676 RepID=A0AAV6KIZ3_9ERIC|nr:hypothetical protein RHGRI_010343 [Rhododendron griersonianum]
MKFVDGGDGWVLLRRRSAVKMPRFRARMNGSPMAFGGGLPEPRCLRFLLSFRRPVLPAGRYIWEWLAFA